MANYVVIYVDMNKIALFTQNEDLWTMFFIIVPWLCVSVREEWACSLCLFRLDFRVCFRYTTEQQKNILIWPVSLPKYTENYDMIHLYDLLSCQCVVWLEPGNLATEASDQEWQEDNLDE